MTGRLPIVDFESAGASSPRESFINYRTDLREQSGETLDVV
jgi:hypothetical protein